MSLVLLALGLVLVIEGLVLALAPLHVERALSALAAMSALQRRAIGLAALVIGTAIVALVRASAI